MPSPSPLRITQKRIQPSKRGSNRATYVVRDAFDKTKRKERTFHNENEATAYRLEAEFRALLRRNAGGEPDTVRAVGAEMLINQIGLLRPGTLEGKGYHFARILLRFGDAPVIDITGKDLADYLAALRILDPDPDARCPPSTSLFNLLNQILVYAIDTRRIRRNPMEDVIIRTRKRKKRYGPKRMPTGEQIKVMLKAPPLYLLKAIAVSLLLGTRLGETVALDRQDFSPDDMSFQIWKQHEGGAPKTEAGYRFAPVIDRLMTILGIEGDGSEFAGIEGPLLLDKYGKRLTQYQFTISFYRWQVEMGWAYWDGNKIRDNITIHQLRHGFVALGLWTGAPMESIAAAMGHANSAVTEHTYAYLIAEKNAGLTTWGVAGPEDI